MLRTAMCAWVFAPFSGREPEPEADTNAPAYSQAEVNDIIKQKFLAELGKLLTFMYEEDRQTALAMYSKMFDDAADERDLVHFLGSPTRQAVVIARAYNDRVRKLQVESQSREQDGAEAEAAPDFVLAIDRLYREYFPSQEQNAPVLDDQFSLFLGGGDQIGVDRVFRDGERHESQQHGQRQEYSKQFFHGYEPPFIYFAALARDGIYDKKASRQAGKMWHIGSAVILSLGPGSVKDDPVLFRPPSPG